MNEISKKENEFNKKINFLEDKEKLLDKEKLDFENKKREFQKEIENYKQENDDLNKKKFELENQIKEKEKQLNNLNNKILKNQEESGQNYHNTNYKNNSQNDNDTVLSKSIGASTLIKNIENRRNNQININQMNNILMNNNLMNNNLMSNNLMNNNLMKNNQMNNYLDDNNNNIFEINNNSIEINNIYEANNSIGMNNKNLGINYNNFFGKRNNNFQMNKKIDMNNNMGVINNIIGINNDFEINNSNYFINNNVEMNKNLGLNQNFGMNNIIRMYEDFEMNNNNFEIHNNNEMSGNFEMNNNLGIKNKNLVINNNIGINKNIVLNNKNIGMNNNKGNQNMNLNINIVKLNPKRIICKNELKQRIKNEPIPIKTYSKPPLIGLNNIGSKHFINAVLQCFSQTEILTNYFLKLSRKKEISNDNTFKQNNKVLQLCPAYYELIHNLWSKSGIKSYSPTLFMDYIDKICNNDILKFIGEEAEDIKKFIIFLLNQFHKELQKTINSKNNLIKIRSFNQYDKDNAFKLLNDELQESGSIISDIFFGINEINSICLNCKKIYNSNGITNPICYNYETFNLLIFPLEEVKKMKKEKMKFYNINMSQNNIVNLYECFAYKEKEELFTGDNKNYCNLCKQLSEAKYKTKIFICPNILILILNRGNGNIYNVKLIFNELIDITQFILKKDMPKITYNLYGVITLIGENKSSAHYVAECKSPVDNKWYRYNDNIVSPIQNFQKEVIDYGTPYVLFYKKNIHSN